MNNQPITYSDSTIEMIVAKERLRQAHHSFNLAFVMTAACVLISFAGVGLVLLGKADEGTITATLRSTSIDCLLSQAVQRCQ
jgi:hypothetical protein